MTSGICTARAERHQRAQTQVTFDPDSSLLYFCCPLLDSQTAHQEQHLYVQKTHTYTYINIFAILSKSFLSAMFTTLYSISHRSRTFNLCTQKQQRRSSLCSAHLFLKSLLQYYRVLSTDLFFNHKPEYRCR